MKNPGEIESGTDSVHVKLKPGTFIIFPSYLTHRFAVDLGIDTFRFIHFNIQAVRNSFYEK